MPEKTTYTRKIPEPQAWQNKQRSTSLSSPRVIPSASHNIETIKVPEIPRTTQTQHTINASVPSKPAGGDMAISPLKSVQRQESISSQAPKTVKMPVTIKSTALKRIQQPPKISSNRIERNTVPQTLKIKPPTPSKVRDTIDLPELPMSPEQRHYLKALAEQDEVKRYILEKAAEAVKVYDDKRDKDWWHGKISAYVDRYNETTRLPRYTLEEIKEEMGRDTFGHETFFDTLGRMLPESWEDTKRAAKKIGSKLVQGVTGIGKAGLIASIPALMVGMQIEASSPEQRVKNGIDEGFRKLWETYAPPSIRGIFDIGDITEIKNKNLYNIGDYISKEYMEKVIKALENATDTAKAAIGIGRGNTPDTQDKAIQANRWNYFTGSSLPFGEKLSAFRYINGREFVNNFLELLPQRYGVVSLNVPRLQRGLYDLISKGVSPEARSFAEELRNIGMTQLRASPPKSFYDELEKPKIRLTNATRQNELGVSDMPYGRGTNLAGDVEMPKLSSQAIALATHDNTLKYYVDKGIKLRNEYKRADKVRDNAKAKLEDIKKDHESALIDVEMWREKFKKYEDQSHTIIPKTSEEIYLAHDAEKRLKYIEKAQKQAENKYKEAIDNYAKLQYDAFWAIMNANEYAKTGKVGDPNFRKAAEDVYKNKFNRRSIEDVTKEIKGHEEKLNALETKKASLENINFFGEGTEKWPLNSLNQLTSMNFRGTNKSEQENFDRHKTIVYEFATNPPKMQQILADLKKMEKLTRESGYGTWLPEYAQELAKGKEDINAPLLARQQGIESSGDGTVDYALVADKIYKLIPKEYASQQSNLKAYSSEDASNFLFHAAALASMYKKRVEKAKDNPEIAGKPSFDLTKKKKKEEELNKLNKQIENEEEELKWAKTRDAINQERALNNMKELYGGSDVPFPQVVDINEPSLGSSIHGANLQPPANPVNPISKEEVWKKLGDAIEFAMNTVDKYSILFNLGTVALTLGGEPLVKKAANKFNIDLGQRLNDPNYIELIPKVNSKEIPEANLRINFQGINESSSNQLRDYVQNYFIRRYQKPEEGNVDIQSRITNGVKTVRESFSSIGDKLQETTEKIGGALSEGYDKFKAGVNDFTNNVQEKVRSFSEETGMELPEFSNEFSKKLLDDNEEEEIKKQTEDKKIKIDHLNIRTKDKKQKEVKRLDEIEEEGSDEDDKEEKQSVKSEKIDEDVKRIEEDEDEEFKNNRRKTMPSKRTMTHPLDPNYQGEERFNARK